MAYLAKYFFLPLSLQSQPFPPTIPHLFYTLPPPISLSPRNFGLEPVSFFDLPLLLLLPHLTHAARGGGIVAAAARPVGAGVVFPRPERAACCIRTPSE